MDLAPTAAVPWSILLTVIAALTPAVMATAVTAASGTAQCPLPRRWAGRVTITLAMS